MIIGSNFEASNGDPELSQSGNKYTRNQKVFFIETNDTRGF